MKLSDKTQEAKHIRTLPLDHICMTEHPHILGWSSSQATTCRWTSCRKAEVTADRSSFAGHSRLMVRLTSSFRGMARTFRLGSRSIWLDVLQQ